ncbi:hypothetical protein AAC387_Pa05g3579 [Persea americana]
MAGLFLLSLVGSLVWEFEWPFVGMIFGVNKTPFRGTNHSELDIFVNKDPSLSTSPTSPKPHLLMGSDHCVWHWCRERRRQRRMRDYGEWREQVQNEGLGRESEWNGRNNCKMRD